MHVVFTDLDGTLLDEVTYSWLPALPAIEWLQAMGIPWVMVSSKTRAEMEKLRIEIGNSHPFVVENGGAAYIPRNYFGVVEGARLLDGYEVLEWGTPYRELASALRKAASESGCAVRGFEEMSLEEVCEATGLPKESARLAMQREYDEPFTVTDTGDIPRLLETIGRAGLRWTRGGRFYHICGSNDKATAVNALVRLFARQFGEVTSIGLGDSLNDLPLLRAVDIPVLIRSHRDPDTELLAAASYYSRAKGPQGWSEAITALLSGTREVGSVPYSKMAP